MTNLQRRVKKLEERLSDPSGLVPHTQKWLEYWDRQIFNFMTDPEATTVPFTIEAYRAVMRYSDNPASLCGSIPEDFMTDPEARRSTVPFTVEAYRAVVRSSDNPASLCGSIPED